MYIGIDGGGTKTKMVSYDEQGQIIKELLLPTIHVLTQPKDKCIEILKNGINELDPQGISKIGIGMAGYGQNKQLRQEIEDICFQAFKPRPYIIESDIRIALRGALDDQDGIVVIAGTGSIALSLHNGNIKRCGGWGSQLGDQASAYWISQKMLEIYCQEADGRMPHTKLYDLVKRECHLTNDYDLITYVNGLNRTQIASLAYINLLAAKENDPHALNIYQEAVQELYNLIHHLSKDFNTPVKVSYIGGVFQYAGEYILPSLEAMLEDQCMISPIHPPEYGAYMLAKKLGLRVNSGGD